MSKGPITIVRPGTSWSSAAALMPRTAAWKTEPAPLMVQSAAMEDRVMLAVVFSFHALR